MQQYHLLGWKTFKMSFLILALPRTRTAWLANFMTHNGVTCTHEGLNGCKTLEEYGEQFKQSDGDANTGLVWFDYKRVIPKDTKILVIDSDIKKAVQYSKRVHGVDVTNDMKLLKRRLDNMVGNHIHVDDINESLKEIWEYLTDATFDAKRAEWLKNINIQIQEPYDFDEVSFKELWRNESEAV